LTTEFIKTLITAGIVNGAQVERATHYESGSSLAERLLSLGYGNENDYYKVLKNKLNLPLVEASVLENIKEDCLNIFPKFLIEKHHFLPFYIENSENSVLRLAMFDPTQTAVVKELKDFIGKNQLPNFKIETYGALPSVLAKALNKYYKLGLPEMFKHGKETLIENYNGPKIPALRLTKDEDLIKLPPLPKENQKDGGKSKLKPTNLEEISKLPPLPNFKEAGKAEIGSKSTTRQNIEEKKQHKVDDKLVKKINEDFDQLSKMVNDKEKTKTEEQTKKPETPIKQGQELQNKKEKPAGAEKTLDTDNENESEVVCSTDSSYKDITESMTEGLNYDEEAPEFKDIKELVPEKPNAVSKDDVALDSIESANTKEEIIKNVLSEIKKLSSRCLILFVRNDTLSAIQGVGSGIVENYTNYTISLKEPSIFRDVYDSKKEYYGPIVPSHLIEDFMMRFGNQKPMSITLVPAIIDEQVFALIYTEENPAVEEVKNIAASMSKAFSKLLN
jgi:hypothetical protein